MRLKKKLQNYFFSLNTPENVSPSDGDKPPVEKISHYGIRIIIIFIIGFLLWSFLASIESAALAPGKIVVAGNRRVVQHLEGGIVSAINIKNGETVKKGAVLFKIDDTQSGAKLEAEYGEVLRLLANEARLIALIEDKDTITFPDVVTRAAKKFSEMQKAVDNQIASFKAEQATSAGSLKILKQRVLQLEEQIAGVNAQLHASNEQLTLIKEELSALTQLAKEELVDRSRVLSTQREAQRLTGQSGEYQAGIANLKQKIGETQLSIIAERDKLNKTWNEELREVRQKLALAQDRETSARDIFSRTNVVAPIDGTVVNLAVFTVGGVVKPGETLLEIVPQHEELVVEAKINPLDIDVVHTGLIAKVTMTALKTRTTPTLLGTVTYVAADATTDPHTQQNYYEARVHIDEKELAKMDKKTLYPGMPVEVMIITNKMSPWNYFMDPIRRSFRRAFREE